jgi:hypothetical protein
MKARVFIETSDGDTGPINKDGDWHYEAKIESSGVDTLFTSIGEAVKRHEETYGATVVYVTVNLDE